MEERGIIFERLCPSLQKEELWDSLLGRNWLHFGSVACGYASSGSTEPHLDFLKIKKRIRRELSRATMTHEETLAHRFLRQLESLEVKALAPVTLRSWCLFKQLRGLPLLCLVTPLTSLLESTRASCHDPNWTLFCAIGVRQEVELSWRFRAKVLGTAMDSEPTPSKGCLSSSVLLLPLS